MLLSIEKSLAIEYIYIEMMTALFNIAVQHIYKIIYLL